MSRLPLPRRQRGRLSPATDKLRVVLALQATSDEE